MAFKTEITIKLLANANSLLAELKNVTEKFTSGNISAKQFNDEISKISKQGSKLSNNITQNINKLDKEIKNTGKSTDSLKNSITKVKDSTTEMGGAFKSLGSDMLKNIVSGQLLVQGLQMAVQNVIETVKQAIVNFQMLEKGVREVVSLGNAGAKELEASWSRGVKGVIARVGGEIQTTSKALYDLESAGQGGEKAIQNLNDASRAAIAGVTDVSTAVDLGTTAMNVWGDSLKDMNEAFDIAMKTVAKGKTTFPEIAHGLGNVASTAKVANQDMRQVGAAMTELTLAGIKTDEAYTALNAVLKQLAGADTVEKFDKLGIKILDVSGKVRPLTEIFDDIAKKQKEMGRAFTATEIGELIPNIRAMKAFAVLSQMGNESGKLKERFEADFRDVAGTVDKAYKHMEDTAFNRSERIAGKWTVVLANIGESLAPVVKTFQDISEALADFFMSAVDRSELAWKDFQEAVKDKSFVDDIAASFENLQVEVSSENFDTKKVDESFNNLRGQLENIREISPFVADNIERILNNPSTDTFINVKNINEELARLNKEVDLRKQTEGMKFLEESAKALEEQFRTTVIKSNESVKVLFNTSIDINDEFKKLSETNFSDWGPGAVTTNFEDLNNLLEMTRQKIEGMSPSDENYSKWAGFYAQIRKQQGEWEIAIQDTTKRLLESGMTIDDIKIGYQNVGKEQRIVADEIIKRVSIEQRNKQIVDDLANAQKKYSEDLKSKLKQEGIDKQTILKQELKGLNDKLELEKESINLEIEKRRQILETLKIQAQFSSKPVEIKTGGTVALTDVTRQLGGITTQEDNTKAIQEQIEALAKLEGIQKEINVGVETEEQVRKNVVAVSEEQAEAQKKILDETQNYIDSALLSEEDLARKKLEIEYNTLIEKSKMNIKNDELLKNTLEQLEIAHAKRKKDLEESITKKKKQESKKQLEDRKKDIKEEYSYMTKLRTESEQRKKVEAENEEKQRTERIDTGMKYVEKYKKGQLTKEQATAKIETFFTSDVDTQEMKYMRAEISKKEKQREEIDKKIKEKQNAIDEARKEGRSLDITKLNNELKDLQTERGMLNSKISVLNRELKKKEKERGVDTEKLEKEKKIVMAALDTADIEDANKQIEKLLDLIKKLSILDSELKKQLDSINETYEEAQKANLELFTKGILSQEQYEKNRLALEESRNQEEIKAREDFNKQYNSELQAQLVTNEQEYLAKKKELDRQKNEGIIATDIEYAEKLEQLERDKQEKNRQTIENFNKQYSSELLKNLQAIETEYRTLEEELYRQRKDGIISEEEYNEKLFEARAKRDKDRKRAIEESEKKYRSEFENRQKEIENNFKDEKKQLEKQLKEGLITKEEYNKRIAKLEMDRDIQSISLMIDTINNIQTLVQQGINTIKSSVEQFSKGNVFKGITGAISGTAGIVGQITGIPALGGIVEGITGVFESIFGGLFDTEKNREIDRKYDDAHRQKVEELDNKRNSLIQETNGLISKQLDTIKNSNELLLEGFDEATEKLAKTQEVRGQLEQRTGLNLNIAGMSDEAIVGLYDDMTNAQIELNSKYDDAYNILKETDKWRQERNKYLEKGWDFWYPNAWKRINKNFNESIDKEKQWMEDTKKVLREKYMFSEEKILQIFGTSTRIGESEIEKLKTAMGDIQGDIQEIIDLRGQEKQLNQEVFKEEMDNLDYLTQIRKERGGISKEESELRKRELINKRIAQLEADKLTHTDEYKNLLKEEYALQQKLGDVIDTTTEDRGKQFNEEIQRIDVQEKLDKFFKDEKEQIEISKKANEERLQVVKDYLKYLRDSGITEEQLKKDYSNLLIQELELQEKLTDEINKQNEGLSEQVLLQRTQLADLETQAKKQIEMGMKVDPSLLSGIEKAQNDIIAQMRTEGVDEPTISATQKDFNTRIQRLKGFREGGYIDSPLAVASQGEFIIPKKELLDMTQKGVIPPTLTNFANQNTKEKQNITVENNINIYSNATNIEGLRRDLEMKLKYEVEKGALEALNKRGITIRNLN